MATVVTAMTAKGYYDTGAMNHQEVCLLGSQILHLRRQISNLRKEAERGIEQPCRVWTAAAGQDLPGQGPPKPR